MEKIRQIGKKKINLCLYHRLEMGLLRLKATSDANHYLKTQTNENSVFHLSAGNCHRLCSKAKSIALRVHSSGEYSICPSNLS